MADGSGVERPKQELARTEVDTDGIEAIRGQTMQMMGTVIEYKELRMMYACALKEIETKFDVLDTEFKARYARNPISSISTRLKSTQSIASKLRKHDLEPTMENIVEHINDVAGIRVVCCYIDDIYSIADALIRQDDIKLLRRKDYIENPKPNGYRSLHLIVEVPVFFLEQKRSIKVEVQIRTIAMNFWASLEHQIKYKRDIPNESEVIAQLHECAEMSNATDEKMLAIRRRLECAEDVPSEEDALMEKLGKIDINVD